jgi:hypothetical protein
MSVSGNSDDEPFDDLFDERPVTSLSVGQFVERAKQLQRTNMDEFAKFVLTGEYDGRQFQVDPIKNALPYDQKINILRDYDSVLGLDANICVAAELTMYPISKFEDTLRRNVHIKLTFSNQTARICSFYWK